ncbi:LOW QUALITY PROTEIN: uncharacterized protein LOC108048331 [Drosophila rhopaloa]|uniref:LOW QUALITY PROTEIN: uncharacterized protein LOC108048331 n=1 Tax=Drosophila rhopaloa TaxID=1041015 RepID=A0A6P4F5S1_DRORH|nr:LOW QUALITY PROTEIN: uncharacterized protein LOC108048331 [Drosophila rhopaloa]
MRIALANWRAISRGPYKLLHPLGIIKNPEMEQWIGWSIGLLCILQLLQGIRSTNYEVIGDEKTLNVQCDAQDAQGDTSIRDILDISGLTFDVADDLETLHFNGDIKVLVAVPSGPIAMQVDVFRWQRSQWLPTPLSLKRDSLCKSLRNPVEIWFPIFRQVPRAELICPPKKGHIYTLRNVTNHAFVNNMPHVDIAGDLKAVVRWSAGDLKTCAVFFFKVYAK